MNLSSELQLATTAALAAAAQLTSAFATDAGVRSAVGKDIKTQADVAAEAIIVKHLATSGHPIIAEESAAGAAPATGLRWYVDPLDGTLNFSRGFHIHAVSIALWEGDRPLLGVVHDITRGVTYRGIVGRGAECTGVPLRVSSTSDRAQGVLATGFPSGHSFETAALTQFVQRVQAWKKLRMIGSAALSLAMVAQGSFDAYTEDDIMIWDVAAGIALVAAAGGSFALQPGSRAHAVNAFVSNGRLQLSA